MTAFIKTYITLITILLLFTGIFNIVIDPYGIHNIVKIKGINYPKSEMQSHEKLFKAYVTGKIKPKSIAVGTSRADFGLDPSIDKWGHLQPRYNIALAGGDVYVTRRFMEHVSAVSPISKVVIGLDFFTFNAMRPQAADYNGDILAIRDDGSSNPFFMWDIFFTTTLTTSALIDSYTTIINSKNIFAQVLNVETGMRQFVINGEPQDMRNLHNLKITDKKNGARSRFADMENLYLKYVYFSGPQREYYFRNPINNKSMLEEFRKIVTIFKEHNTEAFYFISPAHARQHEVIRHLGLWPIFEQWKKEIVNILENEYPNDNYTLWDFGGYNSITTIEVPEDSKLREFIDSTHYSPYTGDLILSKIFDYDSPLVPNNFGRKLNSKTIDIELENIRLEQKQYINTHKSDTDEIKQMALDADFLPEHVFIQGGDQPYGARSFKSSSSIVEDNKLGALREIENGEPIKEVSNKYKLKIQDTINLNNKYRISRN